MKALGPWLLTEEAIPDETEHSYTVGVVAVHTESRELFNVLQSSMNAQGNCTTQDEVDGPTQSHDVVLALWEM